MSKNKEIKTNAMRILDRMKISYTHHTYECDEFVDGMQIVEMLGLDPGRVYKTLVTRSPANEFFVFVIPVAAGHDSRTRDQSGHRVYPGRLYRCGDEKTV